ncbi:MAG TPA: outer membrane beta-barrel protein [Candidatus Binatia bacterium]|nr:outer membrane beta-barrel protein [Candidatus Binatia bacterium]HET9884638.1 outer membrane beta-barrel protein [Candidatus Binatia bacterium]
MKKGLLGLVFTAAIAAFELPAAQTQDKPLSPGWLSLDNSVGLLDKNIADGKSAIEGALGIGISGFLDTSYQWSSNHPKNPRNISGRYFDKDYNKLVFNYFHAAVEKPEKDWGVGFRLSGDFGRGGELLREATLWGKSFHDEPSAEVREAYLTTTIPIGEGIGVKGGLFVTTLGTEILPNPGAYNDNISRSFLFNYAIPLRHLGVLFSYPIVKTFSVNAGVVTGWDNPRDNNQQPSFMAGLGFTPTEQFALASNFIYGSEQRSNNGDQRFTMSHVATLKPFDPLALILEYTYGREENASLGGTRDAVWQGVAGIASYGWTDRFTTAVRGEFFNDRDGARLGGNFTGTHANNSVAEVTLTGAYKFTKMFLGRVEVRQDWSDETFYRKGASSADKNQTTLAGQLIYTF